MKSQINISFKFLPENRAIWIEWLYLHHQFHNKIWLIFYKKSYGKIQISYNDAVEEALRYGWIDSTVKGIDELTFMQLFTPRNEKSSWFQSNKNRVATLIERGQMMPAGLKKIISQKN